MTSVGLVLGAGGVIGAAYHVGAIAAIAEATGWDVRDADLVVGTSAGSGIGATLRAGFSPDDLFAAALDEPLSEEGQRLAQLVPHEPLHLPERPAFNPLAYLRPASPRLVIPALLSPGAFRLGLLAGMLPRGSFDTRGLGDRIRLVHPDRWPHQATWICAVRLRDGKRIVMGRDDLDVPDIGTAVEASSAVPGFFRPVRIGDVDYVDGGMYSATNADLVAPLGFDLVIVVSTMSAVADAIGRTWNTLGRTLHGYLLGREVHKIREYGTPVVVVQPTRADLSTMGMNPMAFAKAPAVARQAHASVLELLRRDDMVERVDLLRSATTQRATR